MHWRFAIRSTTTHTILSRASWLVKCSVLPGLLPVPAHPPQDLPRYPPWQHVNEFDYIKSLVVRQLSIRKGHQKSLLGLSGLVAAAERDYLVPGMHGCIPGHRNGILDACVGRAALGMNSNCADSGLASLGRYSNIVVNSDRVDADGLSGTGDAPIDSGGIGLAVIANLAP